MNFWKSKVRELWSIDSLLLPKLSYLPKEPKLRRYTLRTSTSFGFSNVNLSMADSYN